MISDPVSEKLEWPLLQKVKERVGGSYIDFEFIT